MKHNCFLTIFLSYIVPGFGAGFVMLLSACASNPNKVQNVQTILDQSAVVSAGQSVGVKNGEMVVLDRGQLSEKLRDLQNTVFALEDHVYGTRKLGTLGQYGELKSCQRKLASRQYGGSGSMAWTDPLDRVTDKEEDLKIGLDEKKELVGVSEEGLRDRVQRFQTYRQILQKRSDEFAERTDACKAQLATKSLNGSESSKVLVNELPKSSLEKAAINQFMCGFVHSGASLESFMLNAFAHGWLALGDFELAQNLIGGSLRDSKGASQPNGFLFNGWKLAFDTGALTVGDLLAGLKTAHLVAWAFDHKSDVSAASTCLSSPDGVWNH